MKSEDRKVGGLQGIQSEFLTPKALTLFLREKNSPFLMQGRVPNCGTSLKICNRRILNLTEWYTCKPNFIQEFFTIFEIKCSKLGNKVFLAAPRAGISSLSNFQKYALIFMMVGLHFMLRD